MTDDKEPDGLDPDFAVGDAGQALFRVWAELNDALLWITILADADDSGKAGIVEEHIVEAIGRLRNAEKALGLRFIPENRQRPSQHPEIAPDDTKNGSNGDDQDDPVPF